MMGGPPERPLTALLAAALVLIVGAFVGGTLLTQAISSRMEADASDIANNAAPHVQQLTLARTALTKIRILAERANEECARQDAPFFADEIERMAGEMQDSVATYLTAPAFPGEEALQQGLKKRMADLRSILTEYVGLSRAGQCETARALEEGGFSRAAAQASVEFGNLVDFNAQQIERLVQEIGETRARANTMALALDVVAVTLASGAGLVLARLLRRDARLQAEYGRVQRERADELEAFAARVAHDVRSPLSAIHVSLHLLRRAPEEGKEAIIDRARRSADRLNAVVTDLYAFASAGARPDPHASCAVAPVVNGVLEDARPAASMAGVAMSVEVPDSCEVACAPGVLVTLLSNLLSNAIKHAGREGGKLAIRIRPGAIVRFEVEDDGPGIPVEDQERMFQPYVRGKSVATAGLGLGLATVKRLAESHGGSFGVRSSPGAGSTFWFEIPGAHRAGAEKTGVGG
ncbi:MAG: HAMP domain-containing histidine kinase [Deltaproteobacteria bacterium]|nr:MAG: HAMP domain-containing histidine kinase [Deltaproteobacteria bacterium]